MGDTSILLAARFGYGVRPGQELPASVNAVLAALKDPDPLDRKFIRPTTKERIGLYQRLSEARKGERDNVAGAAERFRDIKLKAGQWVHQDMQAHFGRAAFSEQGFRERLVAFWVDHFTVAGKNQRVSLLIGSYLDEAIRPNIDGAFTDILKAVVLHPAMLEYLDQVSSIGPNSPIGQRRDRGLNENLAREVLELHTLGVGSAYTQNDVRRFAKLLTGLQIDKNGMKFNQRAAEPGRVRILGNQYGGDTPKLQHITDFLDDLAVHPETAKHIAHKMAVHFVSQDPDPDLVEALAKAFRLSKGNLHMMYTVLLKHPASRKSVRAKVKWPMEFVVSAVRVLDIGKVLTGITEAEFREGVILPLQTMGQNPFRPSGPDGWSEDAEDWITPAALAARIEWVAALAQNFGQDTDPRELLTEVLGSNVSSELQVAVTGAETKWEGVALMLASPEFNRR